MIPYFRVLLLTPYDHANFCGGLKWRMGRVYLASPPFSADIVTSLCLVSYDVFSALWRISRKTHASSVDRSRKRKGRCVERLQPLSGPSGLKITKDISRKHLEIRNVRLTRLCWESRFDFRLTAQRLYLYNGKWLGIGRPRMLEFGPRTFYTDLRRAGIDADVKFWEILRRYRLVQCGGTLVHL